MAGFFGLFNYSKPGKGVSRDEPEKKGFFTFFDIFFRKFWHFSTVSLLYGLLSMPMLIIYFLIITYLLTLFGISNIMGRSALSFSLYITVFFVTFLGSGPVSAGLSYVLRNFARQEHAWVWDDMWSNAKDNAKQGFLLFLIDILMLALCPASAYFYIANPFGMPLPELVTMCLGILIFIIFAIYIMAHFYIYQLMVTFRLPFTKLLKNSFILTMARLPQNLLIFILAVSVYLVNIYLTVMLNISFLLLFPVITFAFITFMYIFYANHVIEDYQDRLTEKER